MKLTSGNICILSVIDPTLKDQIATLFGCMGIRGGCSNFTLVARKGLIIIIIESNSTAHCEEAFVMPRNSGKR